MTYYSGVCSTPFWDLNLIWHMSNPNFTLCFQNTALTIVPFILVLCGSLFDFKRRKIEFWTISWNFYNITCLLASLLIITLKLMIFAYNIIDHFSTNQFSSVSSLVSPGIFAISYTVALFWKIHLQRKGIVSSGGLFMFWAVSFLCEFFRYRTYIMNILDQHILQNNLVTIWSSIASFPLICLMLSLNIISDVPSKYLKCNDLKTATEIENLSSYPSRIFFMYVTSLIKKGSNQDDIYSKDIWDIEDDEKTESLCKVFLEELEKEKKKCNGKVKVFNILFKLFFKIYTLGFFLRLASDMIQFCLPFLLQISIGYINSDEPLWKGILYSILLIVPPTMKAILITNFTYIAKYIGLKIKAMMTAGIFHKGLMISSSAKQRYSVGEMVNLMAVDSQKYIKALISLPQIIIAPITFTLSIYFLWSILGPSCLAGVAVLIILTPINAFAITIAKKLQRLIMLHSDQRLKFINEILNGMKVLKMYAWENAFANEIQGIRENEVKLLSRNAFIMALTKSLWTCASILMTLASFAVFVLIDDSNVMTPSVAFVSLTLFNIIQVPLNTLPIAINSLIELCISTKRLSNFMNESELNLDSDEAMAESDNVIEMKDASFTWGEQNEAATITDININVKKGSLVAIVGKVGSGKSSLISAFLGNMRKKNGTVRRKGKIAYVPQQAWIQNATVRNNIIFYKKYEGLNYDKVIEACALKPDFKLFLAGDMTEIGEEGVNLSGGQKQRVSIARAVYNDADVYVLDDPLSAVDAQVGKHIFEKVIGPKGMLAAKTRILSTNSLAILSQCDQVMVMNDGFISECGTYKESIANDGAFSDLIKNLKNRNASESNIDLMDEFLEEPSTIENLKRNVRNKSSCLINKVESLESITDDLHLKKEKSNKEKLNGKLIVDESMEIGKVKFSIYWAYLKQMGKEISFFCFFAWILFIICITLVNTWLSNWSNDSLNLENYGDNRLRNLRLIVYCIGAICQVSSVFVGLFMLCYGALRATKRLHNNMLDNIIRSPMSFFDTTPIGRIMNRFSKDINTLDNTLLNYLQNFSIFTSNLIASLVIIISQSPLILIVMLPLSLIFIYIQRLYLNITRQLKRIESISRSPIYSIFSESLSGSSLIRAYKMENIIANKFYVSNDENQKALHCTFLTSAWLEVTLALMSAIVSLTAALFVLLLKDKIEPSEAGLAISFAINMTAMFILCIQSSAEIEICIVSGERILEYTMLESEAEWKIEKTQVDDDWPHNGTVEFNNYTTKYRPELDLVLKGIDCKINPGEKIGICGRTGAGKSSLTLALFRIIEAASGSIKIDDHDISKLGLHDLRENLTIIPQDPVLFTGALRFNLDPFSSYSDEKIWKAVDLANLKPYVTGLPEGLQSEVSEGGSNMSVGQRQLVCLARALLRKTKVLLLDEATAAVDLETDQLIPETIRKEFSDHTVITIAHRLNTIMDSSRVMVLSDGVIVEFDTPQNLLDDESSYFFSMVKDSAM